MDFLTDQLKKKFSDKKPEIQNRRRTTTKTNPVMPVQQLIADIGQLPTLSSWLLDKAKVAGATADILDAAGRYGKFDEKSGVGQYLEKAENYLNKYETSHSHSSSGGSHGGGSHGGGAGEPAGKKGDEKSGSGSHGFGDYAKMAQGFMK
ncbi:BnaA02g36940D [Brassica napus]|uniref:BnaA02g36940D protein n=1 Tax=Brassica napus TaxID=3708 RepID=A0A078IX27_BRANA|nr:BnaA02g36940D [Brassica napus]